MPDNGSLLGIYPGAMRVTDIPLFSNKTLIISN